MNAPRVALRMLSSYRQKGFDLIPLKARTKIPLVKWKEYALSDTDLHRYASEKANWAIRCDDNFHALDFDDPETYQQFVQKHGKVFSSAPVVKTGRGYHIWFKPKQAVNSFNRDGVEVKGLGSLIAIPPSVHPGGVEYQFIKPPNGHLPEIDLDTIFELPVEAKPEKENSASSDNTPSEFALKYGKSSYPQALCGRATKVFTRGDEEMKHLVSLRCWKWHCPRCARLLKRYWLRKLEEVSFRFIIKIPSLEKPTTLLRRLDKPNYAHIVADGEGWLFLAGCDAERVWSEVSKAGYELIAGDVTGPPTKEEVALYLDKALCPEQASLNTRRKITHSRNLLKKPAEKLQQQAISSESIRNPEIKEEREEMEEPITKPDTGDWNSQVLMKTITEVAKDLEAEGWDVIWSSEVEAIAVKKREAGTPSSSHEGSSLLDLLFRLGIDMRKAGNEYVGLCPFHEDRNPSLSVNPEKDVWHCFGCGKSGNYHQFLDEWKSLH